MELRQMEYLVTLADERHFTRAAQLMGVSQAGLSAGIRGLEQELGASLFTRTTRRVEPTDAALALLPHARAMLDQERAARDAVVHATRQVSGTLRIGTEQCIGVIDATAGINGDLSRSASAAISESGRLIWKRPVQRRETRRP